MFDKVLKYIVRCSNIKLRDFEEALGLDTGGIHMSNEEYKRIIIELVRDIENQQILISIYTVVKNLAE